MHHCCTRSSQHNAVATQHDELYVFSGLWPLFTTISGCHVLACCIPSSEFWPQTVGEAAISNIPPPPPKPHAPHARYRRAGSLSPGWWRAQGLTHPLTPSHSLSLSRIQCPLALARMPLLCVCPSGAPGRDRGATHSDRDSTIGSTVRRACPQPHEQVLFVLAFVYCRRCTRAGHWV